MTKSTFLLVVILVATASAQQSASPPSDVRYVDINGVRYQEVRTRVNQPVRDMRYVDQQQVTYQNHYRTAIQSVPNNTYVPQTSYESVPRLYDWWRVLGIFGEPYVAYGVEPRTHWQVQTQYVPVPVTQQVTVPYTRTARIAVPYLRFEEREQVTRVAVGPAPGSSGQYAANTRALPPASSLAAPQVLTPNPPVAGPPSRIHTLDERADLPAPERVGVRSDDRPLFDARLRVISWDEWSHLGRQPRCSGSNFPLAGWYRRFSSWRHADGNRQRAWICQSQLRRRRASGRRSASIRHDGRYGSCLFGAAVIGVVKRAKPRG